MILFFKLSAHSFYFFWSLKKQDFKEILKKCHKTGFLKNQKEFELADRILRRSIVFLNPKSGCLLYSLVLLRASQLPIDLLIEVKKNNSFESHAFVRVFNQIYSTARIDQVEGALVLWTKKC